MSLRAWLGVYLRGAAMGAADAVPGVSGGTIALITGIYARLIDAIAGLDPRACLALLGPLARTPVDADARATVRDELVRMDVPFLCVLGVGVLSAVVTVANVVQYFLTTRPVATYAFFFGLVLASVVVLAGDVSLGTPRHVTVAVAGFALAFVASGTAGGQLPANPVTTFFVGALAICAMVLPGISGSLILLTLRQYDRMTGAVHGATAAALAGDAGALVAHATTLVVFMAGALVGLLSFARVVAWAFEHYRAATLTFLVALMTGALRAPLRLAFADVSAIDVGVVGRFVVLALCGALVILALERASGTVGY
ncbi:putative membrane protein [Halarchaeum rubridurum]|uniref:DUF368 domain-containing protein n=1 Tax=Halarchaeum rubridurum TaxID=489911 RepID=A0A830FZ40_9EURY|nr:DUF368 domain-containing protein [Halarchaeum rubridurum]MBP1953346.1 putative membrane protein [Halarchaeum rubridurum]GGM66044.1 DUF368 domain-containing protein [Halarchaeum rubridurum]